MQNNRALLHSSLALRCETSTFASQLYPPINHSLGDDLSVAPLMTLNHELRTYTDNYKPSFSLVHVEDLTLQEAQNHQNLAFWIVLGNPKHRHSPFWE